MKRGCHVRGKPSIYYVQIEKVSSTMLEVYDTALERT